MGLIDLFRKNKKITKKSLPEQEEKKDSYDIFINDEWKMQIDYIEGKPDFNKYYDTTTLIIEDSSSVIANCKVSWYNQYDTIIINRYNGREEDSRTNYKDILVKLNYGLLQSDDQYVKKLMVSLLDRRRVNSYLENGMMDNPEKPCGKYIGGVEKIEGEFKKSFENEVGKWAHNLPEMVEKRRKAKEYAERQRMEEVKRKKEQIIKLQKEVDDLSK